MYEMRDEYLTGIESIDAEHRRLFYLAEEVYQLLNEEYVVDKYDGIKKVLQELKDYTHTHFEHEEAYMESINYKKMFTQKVQHQAFCDKLDAIDLAEIEDKTPEEQDKTVGEILEFLTDWLVHHILETDKQIGQP